MHSFFIPGIWYELSSYSPVYKHSGGFQCLDEANNAAMNFHIQVFVWICTLIFLVKYLFGFFGGIGV
jgi:hypothetical protein